MTALATFAVALAVGTWLGIRWAEAGRRVDDLLETVLNTPLPQTSACAACDPGAADTRGPRRTPPSARAPLNPPAADASAGLPAAGSQK